MAAAPHRSAFVERQVRCPQTATGPCGKSEVLRLGIADDALMRPSSQIRFDGPLGDNREARLHARASAGRTAKLPEPLVTVIPEQELRLAARAPPDVAPYEVFDPGAAALVGGAVE